MYKISIPEFRFIHENDDGLKVKHQVKGHQDWPTLLRHFCDFLRGCGYVIEQTDWDSSVDEFLQRDEETSDAE